jgi:hypothetical protein
MEEIQAFVFDNKERFDSGLYLDLMNKLKITHEKKPGQDLWVIHYRPIKSRYNNEEDEVGVHLAYTRKMIFDVSKIPEHGYLRDHLFATNFEPFIWYPADDDPCFHKDTEIIDQEWIDCIYENTEERDEDNRIFDNDVNIDRDVEQRQVRLQRRIFFKKVYLIYKVEKLN